MPLEQVCEKKRKSHIAIIAKATHDCNLGCSYCYVDPNAERGQMSELTLRNMTNQSLENHDSVSFIWHGGEPLKVPLDFYRKAVEFQQQYSGKEITNGFQTNGTLVTPEVIDFCKQYKFNIGFSLDGPEEINDLTRHYPTGESSFNQTMEGIRLARNAGLGGGIIVVLNKHNIHRLDEIYSFAKENKIGLKLNPLIKSGAAVDNYKDLGISPSEYGVQLVKLFDKWVEEGSELSINPFEEIMGNILTGNPWGCNYSASCQNSFISVGPQGDVYPCGRFDGVGGFHLGNINSKDIKEILQSSKRLYLRDRFSRLEEECGNCEFKSICNSGCMHNAYMKNGKIDDKDYYCASHKTLFSHIGKFIQQQLEVAEVK